MTQNKASREDRLTSLFARASTPVLITSLRKVVSWEPTPERSQVRHWLIDELEERYPKAAEAVEEAFERATAQETETGEWVEVDYVKTLINAINKIDASSQS